MFFFTVSLSITYYANNKGFEQPTLRRMDWDFAVCMF